MKQTLIPRTETVTTASLVLIRSATIFISMAEAALNRFYYLNGLTSKRGPIVFLTNASANLGKYIDAIRRQHTAEHIDEELEMEEAIYSLGGHLAAEIVTPSEVFEFLEAKANAKKCQQPTE